MDGPETAILSPSDVCNGNAPDGLFLILIIFKGVRWMGKANRTRRIHIYKVVTVATVLFCGSETGTPTGNYETESY